MPEVPSFLCIPVVCADAFGTRQLFTLTAVGRRIHQLRSSSPTSTQIDLYIIFPFYHTVFSESPSVAVSKNRGENRPASLTPNTPCIRLPHPDHTRWYLQYKYRKYTQPGSRRTNEKNETDYRLCFSKWWNFFIVTATGNRDTQGKKNNEGQGRKKISGVLPQEESATGKGSFSNWQSKKNLDTHTQTRARDSY